ncbi:MAG: chemotaxis protein CheC [Promethearchaeota archaeon]
MSKWRRLIIEEYIEKGSNSLEQVQHALAEDTQHSFKIYIRLNPTCKLRKVRLFIIFRALSKIGRIYFSKPNLKMLETSDFGLEIELYYITDKNQLDILKTLEEILEIENKVIMEMDKDKFLDLFKEMSLGDRIQDGKELDEQVAEEKISSNDLDGQEGKYNEIEDLKTNILDQSLILKENQKDALQEIGNIGTGNAANALARMINKRVDINIPFLESIEQEILIQSFKQKKKKRFLAWCDFAGQNESFIIIEASISDITKLASFMIDGSDDRAKEVDLKEINFVNDFSELLQSAFSELVSILFNHFTMAIGNLLGTDFKSNFPQMVISENDQLHLFFTETLNLEEKSILVVSTDIIVRDLGIEIKMLFMPRKKTLEYLLSTLSQFL